MDWNLSKCETVKRKLKKHLDLLSQIAPFESELSESAEKAKELLKNDETVAFWHTYIRPFETGDLDLEKINDISDRQNTIEIVQNIAKTLADGKELDASDRHFLSEYMDVKISKEEDAYYQKYVDAIYADAERRVGKNLCAYSLVLHSMRLCRLIALKAPPILLRNEECAIALYILLHNYGISMERVDVNAREQLEKMEQMSDEELDELL